MRCFVVFLLLVSSSFAQSFSKTEYAAGTQPGGIVSADFNADGVADLAVTNSGSNSVSLLLGRGDGTFNPASTIAVGANPTEITSADLNGDSVPDLVVATRGAITILYMRAGSATRFDYLVSGSVSSVTTGDFNQDEKTDIAAAVEGKVLVLLNHFDESFSVGSTLSTDVPASVARAADFNRDGTLDLAIGACCQGTDVTYGAFYVASGNGDGTFAIKTSSNQSDGTKLTVADVTGDGLADLIMPYVGCHTPCQGVEVIVNGGNFDFTRFGGAGTSDLDYGGAGPAVVGDFNLDGKLEVASSAGPGDGGHGKGYDKMLVWPVGADGKFADQHDYVIGTNTSPSATTVADFNHDGKTDFAIVEQRTGKVAVFLNNTGTADARSDFDLTVQFSPQTVKAGDKAHYEYYLEATNGVLPAIQFSCSGLSTGAACSFDKPASGPTALGFLTIATTPRTSASLRSTNLFAAFAMLTPFGLLVLPDQRRKRTWRFMAAVLAILALSLTACGGGVTEGSNGSSAGASSTGSSTPPPANSGGTGSGGSTTPPPAPAAGPTPAGTYQVTVIATGGGITRTQAVTLVVQ